MKKIPYNKPFRGFQEFPFVIFQVHFGIISYPQQKDDIVIRSSNRSPKVSLICTKLCTSGMVALIDIAARKRS